jgi:hypothetical protein
VSSSVLRYAHYKIYSCLSNRLTIDHNRYFVIVSQVNFLLLHFGTSGFHAANRPDPVPAISLTSLQAVPTVSASSSIVLPEPFIRLPLLHCPWVFQLKACFSETEKFLFNVWGRSTSISAVWFPLTLLSPVHASAFLPLKQLYDK